jgi:pimeloyl-ACP methyl ester carboxylesterase
MSEVSRREPAFASVFPIAVSHQDMVPAYRQHQLCNDLSAEEIKQTLDDGLTYLTKQWTKGEQASNEADPIAQFLCDSIIDARCAAMGLIALRPHSACSRSIEEVLAAQYSRRQTLEGVGYYVRNGGSRPLLLINATGTPITIWNQFLSDETHDFTIILPERRGSDLFRGGLQQYVDISADSADLSSILNAESLELFDILAWCHGARVALDLANSRSHQISSMVLLAPVSKGIHGITPNPSNFERDLQPLFEAVGADESLAPFLSTTIARQPPSPDWKRWTKAPATRAQTLFSMPSKALAADMMAPLADPQSFINMGHRVTSDERYPMDQALRKLEIRTMVIMGSDDNIVSNDVASLAIKKMCRKPVPVVVIGGSGHYMQDLQYHYFRWLMTEFLEKNQSPSTTARIRVEYLGGS